MTTDRRPSGLPWWMSFKGNWTQAPPAGRRLTARKTSSEKGAEASISFEGSGAIVVGPYLPTGGTADVYLDGKLDRTVDVYPDEHSQKTGESVWHAFKLKPGKHEIRVVVRGERYKESRGSEIGLEDLIVFR